MNAVQDGGTTPEQPATDDPDSSRGLNRVLPLEGGRVASHFDPQILDRTRHHCARLLPNPSSSSLDLSQDALADWSQAMRLLLGRSPEGRQRLAEFLAPRLQSSIEIYPAEVWTRDHLLAKAAATSAEPGTALIVCSIDGLVDEPFWEQTVGHNGTARQAVNIDHHQGATADTPSSCIQFLDYTLRTFDQKLAVGDNRPVRFVLLANDGDQDVCTTKGLAEYLAHILRLNDKDLREVAEYLSIQDLLDRHAAMVPINPDSPHLGWNAHITQPYTDARRQSLFNLPTNPSEADRDWAAHVTGKIIHHVSGRFGDFVKGNRSSRPVSTNIQPVYEREAWCLIDESDRANGEMCSVGAMRLGKQLLVKMRPTGGGRYVYSFNHADPKFFNSNKPLRLTLPRLYQQLQILDPQASYGGSERCGGCRAGTLVAPPQMVKNIDRCLREQ